MNRMTYKDVAEKIHADLKLAQQYEPFLSGELLEKNKQMQLQLEMELKAVQLMIRLTESEDNW